MLRRLAWLARPSVACVGRRGRGRRDAASPASPAPEAHAVVSALTWQAPAALAWRPRARAPGRRDLRAPDVGLLRPLRHARRRPGGAAAAPARGLPDPHRPRDRARHGPDGPAPARARAAGAASGRTTSRSRRCTGAGSPCPHGSLVYILLRHPRALSALGGPDRGVLRPRVRRSTGSSPTAPPWWAGGERRHAARPPDHGRGRRAGLEAPLAAPLPFA